MSKPMSEKVSTSIFAILCLIGAAVVYKYLSFSLNGFQLKWLLVALMIIASITSMIKVFKD